MLTMTKIKANLFDSIDYQNAGPKKGFSNCFHSCSWSMFCDVQVCYRLKAVVVKAMHTTTVVPTKSDSDEYFVYNS